MPEWSVEQSAVGRIVVAPHVPSGYSLFYTTRDFPGRLNAEESARLTSVASVRAGREVSLTTCHQVHGVAIGHALSGKRWQECDACDALWSGERGVALGIKVADCLPVTMVDPIHSVAANVHSGWRGAVQRITATTLDALRRNSAFDPAAASAWLGPSIRVCCFEVGEEVVDAFSASYPDAARFVDRSRGAKPHVDVPGLTAHFLAEAGFDAARIHDSGLCTRCEGSIFHSFRRDANAGGRNFAVVAG